MKIKKIYRKFNQYYDILGEETKRVFFNFLRFFDNNKIFFSKNNQNIKSLRYEKILIESLTSSIFINFEYLIFFSDELSDILQEQYIRLEPYLRLSFSEFFKNYFPLKFNIKEFWVSFYNVPNRKKFKFVDSRLSNKLITISGMITRISDYFPKLLLGTFQCSNLNCNYKIWHIEETFIYIEPKSCKICGNVNWILICKESVFIFIQELKIQEINKTFLYQQMYSSINMYVNDKQIGIPRPGQRFIFTGSLIILPVESFFNKKYSTHFFLQNKILKKFKKNTSSNLYFSTSHMHPYQQYVYNNKSHFILHLDLFSLEEKKKILKIRNNQILLTDFLNNFYTSKSICEELKLAILLMFIGRGQTKETQNFIIYNNINVCVIDNMSSIKIHFINNLVKFLPEIFYINGKNFNKPAFNNSLFNCTETNQFLIQNEISLFSNKSIYCIDNFNRLNRKSQNVVIKIIKTQNELFQKPNKKLNLKKITSLLVFFDYIEKNNISTKKNKDRNFHEYAHGNFDLYFPLSDNYSEQNQYFDSLNISYINSKNFKKNYETQKEYLQNFHFYLYFIKHFKPKFSKKGENFIVKLYSFLRKQIVFTNVFLNKITIKQVETLIKLSEAISKFYYNLYIEEFQIKAATRLLIFSMCSYTYREYISFQENENSNLIEKKKIFFKSINQKNKPKIFQKVTLPKITSKEFESIFKNLVLQLKNYSKIGIIGLPLRKLLFTLSKLYDYVIHREFMINKLILIVLILRKLIKKQNSIVLVKYYPRNDNQSYINLVCFNEKN